MDRDDLRLYDEIREKIEVYGFDYLLEINELEPEDAIFHLIKLWGMELPE